MYAPDHETAQDARLGLGCHTMFKTVRWGGRSEWCRSTDRGHLIHRCPLQLCGTKSHLLFFLKRGFLLVIDEIKQSAQMVLTFKILRCFKSSSCNEISRFDQPGRPGNNMSNYIVVTPWEETVEKEGSAVRVSASRHRLSWWNHSPFLIEPTEWRVVPHSACTRRHTRKVLGVLGTARAGCCCTVGVMCRPDEYNMW